MASPPKLSIQKGKVQCADDLPLATRTGRIGQIGWRWTQKWIGRHRTGRQQTGTSRLIHLAVMLGLEQQCLACHLKYQQRIVLVIA